MKTKLGVSVGLLAAAMYFACLFGTDVPMLLIAGYVLLFEENQWLKKTVIKAFALCIAFSIVRTVIGFIPDLLNIGNEFLNIFRKATKYSLTPNIINVINSIISLIQNVFFLLFGFLALKQQTIKIGFIDKFVDSHMGEKVTNSYVPKSVPAAQPKKEVKAETTSEESQTV